MAKGTYSGGGTSIRLGADGTSWGSRDEAENKGRRSHVVRDDNKRPTSKEIELETERESQEERRTLRSFISQCATAHAANKLTAFDPIAPKKLRRRIKDAGGNVKWLEGSRSYQSLFHEAYCRLRKENVPFEKVWGPRGK